jgi:ATP-dependent DNA ligase
LFELKFDGLRAAADTVRGRMISRKGTRMRQFDGVLDLLPRGCAFDGEIVVLDDTGLLCSMNCYLGEAVRPMWPSTF